VGASEAPSPARVTIDDVEYYEGSKPLSHFWASTKAGVAYAEQDQPLERLQGLFAEQPVYAPVYKRILLLAAEEQGVSSEELRACIDPHPLAREPRRFAAYFVDRLEKADALTWSTTWKISETGRQGLALLSGVAALPRNSGEKPEGGQL
jgi:hypothetical protein